MGKDATVGDGALGVFQFFERIGLGWLAGNRDFETGGQGGVQPLFDITVADDPNVARLLFEVRTGWSPQTVVEFWGVLLPVAVLVTLFFLVGIIYCVVRVLQIRRAERHHMIKAAKPLATEDTPRVKLRWNRILEQAHAADEHKWRLAILEADILLNELLDLKGYRGETMGDKMKSVDIAQFNTIDFAWEAHKIRNRIAHDGANFQFDDREVRRVIKLYERVFREFKFLD